MNLQTFKESMKRGLGRCVLELKRSQNVEPYFKTVLWGCTHSLAYNPISEGTRSWYLFELVSCFPDSSLFIEAAARELESCSYQSTKRFYHICSLLACFYSEGNAVAGVALWRVYDVLYANLQKNFSRSAVADYEKLTVEIFSNSPDSVRDGLRLAGDMGNLLLSGKYDLDEFAWQIYTFSENEALLAALRELKTPEANAFLAAMEANIAERVVRTSETESVLAKEEKSGRREHVWDKYGSPTELEIFLENYCEADEQEAWRRLKAVNVGYRANEWHDVYSAFLCAFEADKPLPREMLIYLYEKTLCAFCRESIVQEIIFRGWDTPELREEWKYDSNEDIRELAKKL